MFDLPHLLALGAVIAWAVVFGVTGPEARAARLARRDARMRHRAAGDTRDRRLRTVARLVHVGHPDLAVDMLDRHRVDRGRHRHGR